MGSDDLTRTGLTWDDYGHTQDDAQNWWQMVPAGEGSEEAYATAYKNEKKEPKMSSQICTAWGPLYMTAADGVSPAEELGDDAKGYWSLKNNGEMAITSGFRVFATPADTDAYLYAHKDVMFSFFDHGFTPVETDDMTDDSTDGGDDMADDGAAALLSVAATALAAFLVF